ncbi:DUF3592 domain-containing protein [Flavobacterium hungaricum]|uniref:DUF3592 domain-containing protein n=1 Tax=Flavobacterium hungaricum TaxID=2082725 RepID=A0ABR9TFD9_9FLAO|nr:DUF3592 domain-containing protein [Flavobacterium hungaricum]MBE8724066.1 DUF3592 domain-containing protein [Flavobacterium hungaricum]
MLEFIGTYFWNAFLILISSIAIYISYSVHKEQSKLKKNGLLTEAKMIDISIENSGDDSPSVKVPVFTFSHKNEYGTKSYRVKGKTNSSAKIGEITPVYYNPKNPGEEYYLPKKDFLMKYLILIFGLFFFTLGILNLLKSLHYSTNDYFLYAIISFFSGLFLLFLIGRISYFLNLKSIKKSRVRAKLK